MQVTMLVSINGTRDGQDWPKRGESIVVPDAEAIDLVNAGLAEVSPVDVESAAVSPAETATAPKARKR